MPSSNVKDKIESSISLFYWSEIKFIHKDKENYGDLLSAYIVEKISGKPVKWIHPHKQKWYKRRKKNFLAVGSIIHHAAKNSIVWGSGIIDRQQEITPADFKAVRGPRTRDYLLSKGLDCPEIYGDPALLLPELFKPKVPKKYKLGIIPHYHDYVQVLEYYKNHEDILVLDLMTLDVEDVTRKILSCERTISSSLHGLIVSQSYQIPSVWVKFSDKIFGDDIKYIDYFESVGINPYKPLFVREKLSEAKLYALFEEFESQPEHSRIKELQAGLMEVCPF
ncbi:MAG: polysaccharide pyruvyl transferase family protein [Christiangramia sp.]|uniref:polysaccharide pyruvyl transferase family protein n=1 Tax=Christiangramia sp. TaxID=1931228 RepID=UPI003241E776